jgi:hypothetical protein
MLPSGAAVKCVIDALDASAETVNGVTPPDELTRQI